MAADADDWSSDSDAGFPQDHDEKALIGSFIEAHPPPAVPQRYGRLSCPVVIPQRRPGNKERGFIKAYAPMLAQCGIDQDTFLDFIRTCNKAVQASKWLVAIQAAAAGAGFAPNMIAMGVAMGVQVASGIAAKAQIKWKTNSFLDRMNEEFFRPRGLYCLLMAYNPIPMQKKDKQDVAQTISAAMPPPSSGSGFSAKLKKNLRNPFANVTEGEENLPEQVAPLIFPEKPAKPGKKSRWAKYNLNDFFDKRAQARYAAESNGDVLSVPNPATFKNRYLDPNHPANNGGLLGLLTGGTLAPDPKKQKQQILDAIAAQEKMVREQQQLQMAQLRTQLVQMGLSPQQQEEYIKQYEQAFQQQLDQLRVQAEWVEKGQRRIVQNILYLMIVNMPSDEELAAAREQLHAAERGQFAGTGQEMPMKMVDV